ncbi:MAG: GTP cyclohydrolase IIa [Desulfurococcales archaeon]|nr:GTP cyclohydrolase IIa [Desulfurococcales archaeon]
MRLALIELMGYREWTESLGYDREWLIQEAQASIYRSLQDTVSSMRGFAMPLRHDFLLAVSTGLSREQHEAILDKVRLESRIPVRMASVPGLNPSEALNKAHKLLQRVAPGEVEYVDGDDGRTVMAHVDINGISRKTRERGLVESLVVISEFIATVTKMAAKHGGIAQYLGGDNIIVLLPDNDYMAFAEAVVEVSDVKVGIGVSRLPRRAMELSSKALHMIREDIVPEKIHVIEDRV